MNIYWSFCQFVYLFSPRRNVTYSPSWTESTGEGKTIKQGVDGKYIIRVNKIFGRKDSFSEWQTQKGVIERFEGNRDEVLINENKTG